MPRRTFNKLFLGTLFKKMKLSKQQISELKRNEKLRNLAFKICEALNNDYEPDESVKLLHGMTLPNNLGFVRLYSFFKKGNFRFPSKEGFSISCYQNSLSFSLVENPKPLHEARKWGSSSFFHVIYSTLGYVLRRNKELIVEVKGVKYVKITVHEDLSLEENELYSTVQ